MAEIGDVLVSPDGRTEIAVSTRAQAVELTFAGWAPKHQRPRRQQRHAEAAPKPPTHGGEAKTRPAPDQT